MYNFRKDTNNLYWMVLPAIGSNGTAVWPVPVFIRFMFCFQLILFTQKTMKLRNSKALALWPFALNPAPLQGRDSLFRIFS